jgi:hypothetical protein
VVSNESARGLMDLTLKGYAIGNGTRRRRSPAAIPRRSTRAAPPRGQRSPCSRFARSTAPRPLSPAPAWDSRCSPSHLPRRRSTGRRH